MAMIVLFDGVCNFCNASVNFIIDRDRKKRFQFAALQSEIGCELRAKFAIAEDSDSVVLIDGEKAYTHSRAALEIARGLGFPYSLFYVFIAVPGPVRDWFYKTFAKYRYRFFGRTDACRIPTPEMRERFIG